MVFDEKLDAFSFRHKMSVNIKNDGLSNVFRHSSFFFCYLRRFGETTFRFGAGSEIHVEREWSEVDGIMKINCVSQVGWQFLKHGSLLLLSCLVSHQPKRFFSLKAFHATAKQQDHQGIQSHTLIRQQKKSKSDFAWIALFWGYTQFNISSQSCSTESCIALTSVMDDGSFHFLRCSIKFRLSMEFTMYKAKKLHSSAHDMTLSA